MKASLDRTKRASSALFPPGWLEETSNNPILAQKEIRHLTLEHNRIQQENTAVREERDRTAANARHIAEQCEQRLSNLQKVYEEECVRARKARSALELADDMNARVRRLADVESKKAREAEDERDKERVRVRHLERLVKKLQKDARDARGDGRGDEMLSAIRKMAKSPAMGKRLAAACHPDKAPPELNLVAAELFRLLQDMR
jgi:hypothetical protein